MILDCPNCNARFLVADHLIPAGGRTVRCGKCAHQWHVNPHVHIAEAFAEIEEAHRGDGAKPEVPIEEFSPEIKPLRAGANVPVVQKRKLPAKPFKIAVPVLAALWLVLAFFTYFPHWVHAPIAGPLYRIFGVTDTQGLTFADVHMEREVTDTKTRFIFTGSIINHAPVTRTVPLVHIALNDKQGNAVWGRDYPVNVPLKAGEIYPFRIVNVETSFADSVATIVVDLGNPLELMVR